MIKIFGLAILSLSELDYINDMNYLLGVEKAHQIYEHLEKEKKKKRKRND